MVISLSDVTFAYSTTSSTAANLVLNIPSWSIAAGETVFLHGASGGGKSTLLNLLSGVLTPTNGQITVQGQRLDKMRSRARDKFRAQQIGYVFQQFNLIPYLNAVDNIALANYFANKKQRANQADIKVLLEQLNIAHSDWDKPASELSIGQQQRIAIARALINKPKLLIVDEPTSSLDEKNRDSFMQLLMSLVEQQGITLLFVSHDMSLAHYFSRVEALADINQIAGRA